MTKPIIKLIAMTQGAGELINKNAQEVISYVARVSNPNNQLNFDTAAGLIRYCIKNKHVSIFEHASMTLEINTTRAIAAQILRHRSFCFQEFCMAGDSEVYFDLPGAVSKNKRRLYKVTLEKLFNNWEKSEHQQNVIKKMNVRVFDEETKTLTHAHIKEVFNTGLKEIYEIELENNKKIRCTKEHKVLTPEGFLSLEVAVGLRRVEDVADISKNTFIGCNGVSNSYNEDCNSRIENASGNTLSVTWAKIKSVKYLGEQMTYDLQIDHPSHNYVADGVIVHNSQRYSDTTELTELPLIPDLRRQDTKNRQNSIDDLGDYVKLGLQAEISNLFHQSQNLYKRLLEQGVAKECARFVLPLAVPTKLYMTGNVRSWITYIALREKNGTQIEHQEIAKECKKIFAEQFPICYEALGGDVDWEI